MKTAFLKALQIWKKEPNISFLRILKDTLQAYDFWPADNMSREQVLNFMLRYIQVSMAMQSSCYCYEIIKSSGIDQSSQNLKNKLKSIKAVIDVDNKEKTTNALQLLKIIREAFAHNNDSEAISNWRMDEEFNIHIESKMDKAGNRHNIKLKFADMASFTHVCLANVMDIDKSITELYVNGNKLEQKFNKKQSLSPEQIGKHVREIDAKTQEEKKCSDLQLKALSACFDNEFFRGDLVEKLSSPYRPNFVALIYPYEFNCHNHIFDMQMVNTGLYHLNTKYRSFDEWFFSIFNVAKEDENMTQENMTYLFYFYGSGKMDSVIISNILFSIFSFESFDNLQKLFADTGCDINRIRNSVMHGRFYYNYNKGYDFYDGRNNSDLEYVGTLEIKKITEVAQKLLLSYVEEEKAAGV